jgi:hypothetical protein
MRKALITEQFALTERMVSKAQLPANAAEAEMPSYMESFLAHLRLLVGVPFEYLVPDSKLLPDESIRFFYLDRSWTDRLVDGAVAVGKIGTRDQAHHHGHGGSVQKQLDHTERDVRDLQRAKTSFEAIRSKPADPKAAGVITGFLMRSAAVSGWPQMDVRAYKKILPKDFDPSKETAHQLKTLRLERLAPAVMLALFEGIPEMVICEEPHHGIQFGVHEIKGKFSVFRRDEFGKALAGPEIEVKVRQSHPRVLAIADLRRRIIQLDQANPALKIPDQTGSGALAIELLSRPWRQRFQGNGSRPNVTGTGAFVAALVVAPAITQQELQLLIKDFVK